MARPPDSTPVPRTDAATLNTIRQLGSGGQGEVYLVSPRPPADPSPVAYKKYLGTVRTQFDLRVLERLVRLFHEQDNLGQGWIADRAAWPTSIVEDGGRAVGFLMQPAPPRFLRAIKMLSGATDTLLQMQFLLNPLDYLSDRGILLSDRHRVGLLRDLATTLSWLHEHRVAVGDMSPNNIVVSLDPEPRCFILDCDAMRIRGESVLDQAETPDWRVPSGEDLATAATDVFKFGLLVIRLFANDQSITQPEMIPDNFRQLRDLARQSLGPAGGRPSLGEWIDALDTALPRSSTNTQQIPVVRPNQTPQPAAQGRTPSLPLAVPIAKPGVAGRKLLALIAVIVVVCLGGIALAHGLSTPNTTSNAGNTYNGDNTNTDTNPNVNTGTNDGGNGDSAADQAAALNDLLRQSSADRGNLSAALADLDRCNDVYGDISTLNQVHDGRAAELDAAKNLSTDALPNGDALKSDLVNALQHSLTADSYFISWANGMQAANCSNASKHSSSLKSAQSQSKTASSLKQDFVDIWNPVADQYGYSELSEPDI